MERGTPTSSTNRLRFGVPDIVGERARLLEKGVPVTEIEELAKVVRWCNFEDPWGNRLGLYQDLSRFP